MIEMFAPKALGAVRATGRKGLADALAIIRAAVFCLTVPQLFWYPAATPWVESGRLFQAGLGGGASSMRTPLFRN